MNLIPRILAVAICTSTAGVSVAQESLAGVHHGGAHKFAVEELRIDCRECHGARLNGTEDSMTGPEGAKCIAPDGICLPLGVAYPTIEFLAGEPIQVMPGDTVGVLPGHTVVGCGICHEEVEFETDQGEREVSFARWRRNQGCDD